MFKPKKELSFEREILRLPGQSATDELNDLLDSKVEGYLFSIAASLSIIAFVWISYFQPVKTNPFIITFACLLIIALSVLKILKFRKNVINLKRGIKGERYVGQVLEELREDGYKVFHDVIGDGFNVDHIIVGPTGVFAIETKAWGNSATINNVEYDGKSLKLNGYQVPKNPISQAKSCAHWVSDILQKSTGSKFYVKPLIVLPSKYIRPEVNKILEKEGVYMLNPKNIRAFLGASKNVEQLSLEQINLISFHLSRFIASVHTE